MWHCQQDDCSFPQTISKLSCIGVGRGADSSIILLSFVWQLCSLGQSFINGWRWWEEKKWGLYFHLLCFSPKLESNPLLLHHLGSTVWRFKACLDRNARGSATAVGSRLPTGQCLQMHQLVEGTRLVPLGLESHHRLPPAKVCWSIPARSEYRKHLWFFRNSIFSKDGRRQTNPIQGVNKLKQDFPFAG